MRIRNTTTIAAAVALALGAGTAAAQDDRITERGGLDTPVEDRDREARQEIAEAGDEARHVEQRVEDAAEIAARRDEVSEMAEDAISQLRSENESAANLLEQARGWAVFDTTKGGLIVTGAGGTGLARDLETGEETYMHLGAGGIGLGAGLENYQLVMLFEDGETYDEFVSGRWDGSVSAQAAAGEQGAAAEEQFVDGVRVYRLTDTGLIAQVDITGMRFWASEELNDTQHAALDGEADVDVDADGDIGSDSDFELDAEREAD